MSQLGSVGHEAWARVRADAWPIAQGTAAATIAWMIARHLVDHHQPFFAPIAAVVALNASRGDRGSNAVRLLQGVVVGIVVAQLAVWSLGAGDAVLALATFVAMVIAVVLGGGRIVIAQAAAGAILTVTTNTPGGGLGRLTDALIGTGIALVISQLVFPAEPLSLLRRAETAALNDMAQALKLAAEALETDGRSAGAAIDELRGVRDRLGELGHIRTRSERSARRSPLWRSRTSLIVRENENAAQLDLLGTSALTLTRAVDRTSSGDRHELSLAVSELADVLSALAEAPGDRDTRQQAADRVLEVTRRLADTPAEAATCTHAERWALRQVAMDTMVFAGIEPEHAARAVEHGSADLHIPDAPPTSQARWQRVRRLTTRWRRRRGD